MNSDTNASEICVENSILVRNIYGYWPSFHDAEIVEFGIKLFKSEGRNIANATIKVCHSGQDDPKWVKPGPKCVIEFVCRDISNADIGLNDLAAGGWIDEINVSKKDDGQFEFDVQPSAGLDIRFSCTSISVAGIYAEAQTELRGNSLA
jgi:hypothetical protein